jgi:DASH complex subunit DAM1
MSQHRTPIKRISQGSLRALSRSANHPDAPHGLAFLTPALAELTEEMQTLQSHTQGLRALEDSLTRFNESFASWLYVQNMASLTLDWTQVLFFLNSSQTRARPHLSPLQAPIPASFELAQQRAGDPSAPLPSYALNLSHSTEQDALAAQVALRAAAVPPPEPPQQSAVTEQSDLDPDSTSIAPSVQTVNTTAKATKKVVKKKLTAKEKRERGVTIHFLPLCVFWS